MLHAAELGQTPARSGPTGRGRRALLSAPALLRALLFAALVGACSRSESDWLADTRADDPFVRTLAVVALGTSPWQEPEEVVRHLVLAMGDSDQQVSARAGQALLANEQCVFPFLLSQAGLPDAAIREHLTALTRRLGPAAVGDLQAALAEPDPPAGPFLVDLLRQLGPPGHAALLEASQHHDLRVRRAALAAIAADPTFRDRAAARWTQALDDPSPAIRELALKTLVGSACERLADADETSRSQAADQLQQLGPLAVREMTRLLIDADESDGPRTQVISAWLAARPPADVTAFLAAHHRRETQLLVGDIISLHRHIGLFGEPAVPTLVRELTAADPARRAAAAAALSGLGTHADAARNDLLAALDDADQNVRLTAALALMHIGVTDEAAIDALAHRALVAKRDGDESSARALGTAAVGGLLRQLQELGAADSRDAALDAARSRIGAWEPGGPAWLDHIATHALDEDLRLRAAQLQD